MAPGGLFSRLAAILYADGVAYSRLTGRDPVGVHRALVAAFAIFDDFIGKAQGRVIMKAGDSVLAEFPTISAAVSAAIEIQRAFWAKPVLTPDGEPLRFRIGINLGDVIVDGDNIYGDGVNVAERVQRLARPGGLCITESVYACIAKTTPYTFEFGGDHLLKNIDTPVRIYHFRDTDGTSPNESARNPYAHTRKYAVVLAARMLRRAVFLRSFEPDRSSAVEESIKATFQQIVGSFDGVVLATPGSLACAAFGIPLAHEDDPERAIAAAEAFCQAVSGPEGCAPNTRWAIGIDIGFTTVEHPADVGACRLVGKPVLTAAVLAEEAQRDGITVTRALLPALSRSHHCIEVPNEDDNDEDGRVWRIDGPLETAASRPGPLVGRDLEIAQLTAILLETKTQGSGCIIEIRGVAGIGKTRLADRALSLARDFGFLCCPMVARSFAGAPRGGLVATLLRTLLEIEPTASDAECRAAVQASPLVAGLAPDARLFVYDLLDLPLPAVRRNAFVAALDSRGRREARRSAFLALLARAAESAPVLIIVEDIHRASEIFLTVLRDVAAATPGIPIVMIATQRSDAGVRPGLWDVNAAKPATVTLDLRPLCEREAHALASRLAEEGTDPAFVERCVQRAQGNPFFLEQLLDHVRGDGGEPPSSILSVIAWRIDQLTPSDRRALQAAAILGERFSETALRVVLDEPDYDLLGLIAARFVVLDDDGVRFEHGLVQEAACRSIGPEKRIDLHRRAAEWFRMRDPVRFAEHLEHAKAPEAAAAFLLAGRSQMQRARFAIALGLVERGLIVSHDQSDRFELLQAKGELLLALGLSASAAGVLKEAAEIAVTDRQRCSAALALVQNLILLDQYSEATRWLNFAEPLAASLADDAIRARIHRLRGSLHFPLGDTERCYAEHAKAYQLARLTGLVEEEARALSGLGDAEYARGRMKNAHQAFRRCVDTALEHSLARIEAENRHMIASSLHYSGRLGAALAEAELALEVARRVSHPRAELCCHSCLSVIQFDLGRFDEVERHVCDAQDLALRMGARRFLPLNLTLRAKVARLNGQSREAEILIAEALEEARSVGMSYNGARVLAELALITPDPVIRSEALAEGGRILEAGCIGSDHLWFHRDAIEAALVEADADTLARRIRSLLALSGDQRLAWTSIYAVRGRLIGAVRCGATDETIPNRLRTLRLRAAAFDYQLVAAEIGAFERLSS